MLTQEEQDQFERIYQEERDGVKVRAEAAVDRRIRAIAARPAKTRASRAKWRPMPVCSPGCVPLPVPHESYSTDGTKLFNRDGTEIGLHTSLTGVKYARLYWKGSYDAATGQKKCKLYNLAEVYEKAIKP